MLILNNLFGSQLHFPGGETPSGGQAEAPEQKRTVDFSQKTEVINKSDRINVAEEAKRTMEIAAYKAAYGKLEELAKNYAQELNQNMKMDEAMQVRALAEQIGDIIQYQCDERSFDNVNPATEQRWVDIHLVQQYKQLSELIGRSPLASKADLITQIERIRIPMVQGTTTAQEILAYRIERNKSEQLAQAASFGMIGVVENIPLSDEQTKAAPPKVASRETEKKQKNTKAS